jgi:hypothetical protein
LYFNICHTDKNFGPDLSGQIGIKNLSAKRRKTAWLFIKMAAAHEPSASRG